MKQFLLLSAAAITLQATAASPVWTQMSTGSEQTYAIKTDGTLWAWGSAESGELGNGSKAPAKVSTPTQIGTDADWKLAAGGSSRGFFIKENGTMWSTGSAEGGALGTNSAAAQTLPTQIGTDTDWIFVTTSNCGNTFGAFAIKADHTLWAWGKNSVGLLGFGNYDQKATPQKIGEDADWVSASMGRSHSLALKSDGSIWGAGEGEYGQLGDNSGYNKSFVKVADGDWKAVYAIDNSSYAIKADGTLWAWGENYGDILGLNLGDEVTSVSVPTQITSITGKVFAISGSQHFRAVAVGEAGAEHATKVYTWGKNTDGCLGNGTGVSANDVDNIATYTTPQAVEFDGPIQIVELQSGQLFTVVLTSEGNLLGWGQNAWGQLGTSEPENMLGNFRTTPIEVAAAVEAPNEGLTFDADNIPSTLNNIEEIALTGEWGTDDLAKLIPALGNGQGVFGYNFNTALKKVDLTGVTFKENTSMEKALRNCKALETVIFPDNESVGNIVSLNNAFLNDEALSSINIEALVNVADMTQAFQNCKKMTAFNLSAWNGVTESEMAFQNCNILTTVALPGDFHIGDRCFGADLELVLVDWSTYKGTKAPEVTLSDSYQPFYNVDFTPDSKKKVTIIVPQAAYKSFSEDSYWSGFTIEAATEPGTYTVDAAEIPSSLADAKHLILTGEWNTDKFKALATALGTASGMTAGNSTLISLDMSSANITAGTKLVMQVPGFLGTSAKGVFQKYTALESVTFPTNGDAANFTSFEQAFSGCKALKSVDMSDCTGLGTTTSAFYDCTNLESVTLPASMPLQKELFDRCEALKTIDWSNYSGTTAPTYSSNAIPTLGKALTVIVPDGAYDAFVASSQWSAYNIVKASTAGIEDVEASESLAPRQVYNLRGQYITTLPAEAGYDELPAGLYIIGGKKVYVRK
ncbi:MAG: leucine-rich repeat protein [Clostridium sp.]|nr:leucine-rich repeat protein [Clostridium sp.]